MPKRFPWNLLAAAIFGGLGTERALRALAILPVPELPTLLFVSLAGEAAGALLAAIGLLLASRRVSSVGLALFAVCAVARMAGDVAVYGVRPLIDGVAASLIAIALAASGWIVLERTRASRAQRRNTTGQSSESSTSPSRTWN